jgi:hypothetical protein
MFAPTTITQSKPGFSPVKVFPPSLWSQGQGSIYNYTPGDWGI